MSGTDYLVVSLLTCSWFMEVFLRILICHVFREEILTNAKALVEDTKALVPAAQASQDVLANAAQSAVTSINKLSDCVKLGAAALGADDTNAQV